MMAEKQQNLGLSREFQTFYRQHFDYKSLRQLKQEQYQCIQVHCYPLAETRYAKFSHARAEYCEKECSRTMEAVQGHQTAALATIHEQIVSKCGFSLTDQKSSLSKASFTECKTKVFAEATKILDDATATELAKPVQ